MQTFLKYFNQYDIRGLVGKEINSDMAYKLARLLNAKSIVIAKDNRPSSVILMDAFRQGLIDSGSEIIELQDVSSSPLLYFAHLYLKTDYAVMITGSHNSLEYNGFKFMKKGKPLYGDELKSSFTKGMQNNKEATHKIISLDKEYIKAIQPIEHKHKIAWDCNNSGASRILKQIGEKILLNDVLDGSFAHSSPDPLIAKNIIELREIILKEKCDYGFAFDGDADRLVMIKANGEYLTSDQLIYLMTLATASLTKAPQELKIGDLVNTPEIHGRAATQLARDDKPKIILDMKASQILINQLIQDEFEVILASGGHSIMKEKIATENALLAGEASSHIILNDGEYYPIDDALYIATRIIKYLQNNPLIELALAPIRKEYKLAIDLESKKKFIEKYSSGIRRTYSVIPDEDMVLPGMTKNWWLIRASHTENHILVKYEAMNSLDEKNLITELLKSLSLIKELSILSIKEITEEISR